MSKQTGKKKRKRPPRDNGGGQANRLTRNELTFLKEYVKDYNGTRAYKAAYKRKITDNAAANAAHFLLKKPKIIKALRESVDMLIEEGQITKAMIAAELGRVAFSNINDFVEWGPTGVVLKPSTDLPSSKTAAVSEVSESISDSGSRVSFKTHPKVKALEIIARMGEHLIDIHKVEHTGKDGGPMQWANMPPMPKSIEEWEAQIRAAEAARQKSEEPDGILDTAGGTAS